MGKSPTNFDTLPTLFVFSAFYRLELSSWLVSFVLLLGVLFLLSISGWSTLLLLVHAPIYNLFLTYIYKWIYLRIFPSKVLFICFFFFFYFLEIRIKFGILIHFHFFYNKYFLLFCLISFSPKRNWLSSSFMTENLCGETKATNEKKTTAVLRMQHSQTHWKNNILWEKLRIHFWLFLIFRYYEILCLRQQEESNFNQK